MAIKPRLFVGSSSEAKDLALAVQHELRDIAEVEPWSQGIFRIGSVPLESLIRALEGFDFAVFIFAPNDVTRMRDKTSHTVRDNVLFELGMFIGKLGQARSFFVTPVSKDELHLPSDLDGIIPARYDSSNKNLQGAVSSACFELRKIIRELGPLHHFRRVLYDTTADNPQADFRSLEARRIKDDKPVGDKGRGRLTFEPDGTFRVDRTNLDGKFELHLRRQGPEKPSFSKLYNPPPRVVRITCEARADGAEHTLRFVLKDEEAEEWLANETRTIKPPDWTKLEAYLWIDSTKDFLFRIDDERVTGAPTALFIRNLSIVEEKMNRKEVVVPE